MRTRSRSEKDNYLFLGSITPKVPAKEEKARKQREAGTRRQQITLIFKIVIAITPLKLFSCTLACAFKQLRKLCERYFRSCYNVYTSLITFVSLFFFKARFTSSIKALN